MTPADHVPPAPAGGPIAWLIAVCARSPVVTVLLVAALAGWGWLALRRAPLDAIPDLSDVQVIIATDWEGRSPDLVEDQVTYPLTRTLLAAPRIKAVRGQSFFGTSFVYAIFEDGTDIYWARSRVLEYLQSAQGRLPEGVRPRLGPDATGVGWVFEYALVDRSGKNDLQQLRALQDWNLRYALESVPGVAEVAAVGGFVKQYQIQVDPLKLLAYRVALPEIVKAIRASNSDVGGETIEIAGHEHVVRGRGYIRSLADLEDVPIRLGDGGVPVTIKDVATVAIGPETRRGIADLDGDGEVVGGIVVMRFGLNALTVIDAVKARLAEVQAGLPAGVEIVPTYDRSGLIRASIHTLGRTIVEEMVVVSLVIFLFLLHVRSALVPIITLPVAVLLAFIPMLGQGLTASIMSLGGIAVAIGAMVDAAIIIVENVHRRLEGWETAGRPGERLGVVIGAMQEVGPSVFFALLVITVSFVPIFTLEGVEGRLFSPLAFTKTYAMAWAAVLAVTLAPALAALAIRGRIRPEERNLLNRWLVALYVPVVRFVVRRRWPVLIAALLAVLATVPAWRALGSEFMPPLNEGAILYMPTSPAGMSITEAGNVLQAMDRALKRFPEVESVFGKMGRSESPTDAAPINMVETVVALKPRSAWRPGLTWDGLVKEMDAALQFPGMPNVWWMPIQTRTEMLATGIRSPLGIAVHGATLEAIERTALAIERSVGHVPGVRSAFAERNTGGFFIDIVPRRAAAARLGLRVEDINAVVMTAIGGLAVAETVEGRERYPISVRYAREYRDDPAALGRVLVATPAGAQVPLAEVADVRFVSGPPMLRSEGGGLVGYVFVDVAERPLVDLVDEAKVVVAKEVALPPGVRLEWVGQYTAYERAKAKLTLVVPITLLLVMFLLWLNTRSLVETAMVMLAVPFSLIGAVWLLWALDYHLSVAVWVGLIALAGLDAETGVIMLLYLTVAHRQWRESGRLRSAGDLEDAIIDGAARRIRPKLMTVLAAMLGLLPVLWSDGTGADVMKRIAAPMVGGLVTSFLLELAVYPALFAMWKGRGLPRQAAK
jgi:Cu(I)/Ag(I) efflux system membrane protein CusA/SilA